MARPLPFWRMEMSELPLHKAPPDAPLHVPPSEQPAQMPVPKPGEPIREEAPSVSPPDIKLVEEGPTDPIPRAHAVRSKPALVKVAAKRR